MPYPLTNFEIQRYYQNETKFNDVSSRNRSPNSKEGAYVINLDEYKSVGTQWKAFYFNGTDATHFDSFRVECIPLEI